MRIRASAFYSMYIVLFEVFTMAIYVLIVYFFKHFNFKDCMWLPLYLKCVLEAWSILIGKEKVLW